MKQFESDLKAKAHLKKIKNAKTTIQNKKFRVTQKYEQGEQITLILKLYDTNELSLIPIYKLLKHFGLQQYTREMILRGFGVNINRLAYLTEQDKNRMFQDMKLLPGHGLKFNKIIDEIKKNIENQESEQSINTGSKVNLANESKDDYQEQLQRLLNHYTPKDLDKKSVTTNTVTHNNSTAINIKKQETVTKFTKTNKVSQLNNSKIAENKKQAVIPPTIVPPESTKKLPNQAKKPNSMGKPTTKIVPKQSRPIATKKLPPSLKQMSAEKKKQNIEVDLKLQKIKSLYMSVDGGIMTSTIVNIDLQQSCYCIAAYLQNQIKAAPKKKTKLELSTQQQQISYEAGQTDENEVESILRESYLHPLYKNTAEQPEEQQPQIQEEIERSYEEPALQQQETGRLQESSFLGNNESVCFGVNNSLEIFQQPLPTEVDYYIPTVDSLSNFIKNIVLSAKMEREVPILSVLYVEKFIKNSKLVLNSLNYKRILVSCLLLASKVWDDQSFETPSFSHTFPDYTTVLLNQLQKQILVAINYELKLDKKEYALLYYKMREYRSSNTRSYQNRALNIMRVRELQKGVKKEYRSLYLTKRKSF